MLRKRQDRVGNLPKELTSFVGRYSDVVAIKRRLADWPLVTLTGPGGVGKTRLALRVASELWRDYADGVWLVELDHVRDEAVVPQTVAGALGLHDPRGHPPLQLLADYLADRRVLLVLDNCEHLIDAAAKVAESLLRAAPDLRILATSRESLDIDGEALVPVAPLAAPDPGRPVPLGESLQYPAVALFAERAATVAPRLTLTEANQAAVVEICHRLDGLPLAIELAAAWLPALSPEQIRDRLRDPLGLLTRGYRAAPARRQTLRDCLAWSFDLCTRQEQTLWARLSVFAGGFQLDAVEAVCAFGALSGDDMVELLASLIGKSIVVREPGDAVARYRMLESVRAFGLERLRDVGEETVLRRRHRDWFAETADRAQADWITPRHLTWLDRLDSELPDLRAALEFSVGDPVEAPAALRMGSALHSYWVARGGNDEGRKWLDRALVQPTEPSPERVRAAYTATVLAAMQGDIDAARGWLRHARETAARLDDPLSRGIAVLAGAAPEVHGGNAAGALPHVERALEILQDQGEDFWTLMALAGLALLKAITGDTAGSVAVHERILAIAERHGEVRLRSHSLWALGVSLWKAGEPARAAELVEQSLQLKNRLQDTYGAALCLDALAWIAAGEGDVRRAATLLGVVSSLTRIMGAPAATYPGFLDDHQRTEDQAREALGAQEFQAAFARGEGMTIAEATGYVTGDADRATAVGSAADGSGRRRHGPEPSGPRRGGPAPAPGLTRREWEVCELINEGLSNQEIADRLVISRRTAESHVQNVFNKLGLTNRAGVAAWMVANRPRDDGG